jgi:16S rRNA (uracil1498-N3)-methyltransferase
MIRLFVQAHLQPHTSAMLDEKQAHYLRHVMRQNDGDEILVFNGRDGEWRCQLGVTKKNIIATPTAQTRTQTHEAPLSLLFAPIKRGHGDYTIEKACELGATKLYPIITQRTVIARVPRERFTAISIEAAEQCERLSVPEIMPEQKLEILLKNWDSHKPIILCAEHGDAQPIAHAVCAMQSHDISVLIGPEGGFSDIEFAMLRALPYVFPVTLGKRILRADTAAISAMSIIQALRPSP